jgi:hypothetical protein
MLSCATTEKGMFKQDLDQVYIGSGIEKYFLSDIPSWANFSEVGKCRRTQFIRYVNFKDMHLSYAMEYEQLIQYQLMLNRQFENYKRSTGRETVFLKDENYIIFNVHQQILGGGRDFLTPNFNRIHLISIDDSLGDKKRLKQLKNLMKSNQMSKGHPVFISMCLSSYEVEDFIASNGFSSMGVKGISQSMFTPYDTNFEMNYEYSINVEKIFKDKTLILYSKEEMKSVKGYDKLIKY